MRHTTEQDLWDVRTTMRCRVCDREETARYAALMHSDHWPLAHMDFWLAYCPHCVANGQTPVRRCGYGRWRIVY